MRTHYDERWFHSLDETNRVHVLKHIVDDLLTLEFIGDRLSLNDIESYRELEYINRLGWPDWYHISDLLTDEKLIKLVKILASLEHELHWCGGSVSSVIWVFKSLERRNIKEVNDIAEWIIQNSENDYVPYGTTRGWARSAAEYKEYRRYRRESYEIHLDNMAYGQKLKIENKRIKGEDYQAQLLNQKKNSQARNELIANMYNISIAARFSLLVQDQDHKVFYYPTELFKAEIERYQCLDAELIKQIKQKLQDVRKGAWRALYLSICSLDK